MKEIKCNAVKLENGIVYNEISRLFYDNCMYVLLSNLEDTSDYCIRKLISKNSREYIIGLNDEYEYDTLHALFANKGLI